MLKKYQLTNPIIHNDQQLYQIKALRDFADVKAGDLGGFVMSEENLSHEGTCWIYDDAIATDHARVRDDALMASEATLKDYAILSDKATLDDSCTVSGHAIVKDNAIVSEYATISGHAIVSKRALVTDDAIIRDQALVTDDTVVQNSAVISGNAQIKDHAFISGCAQVTDNAIVEDKVTIINGTHIDGYAHLSGSYTFYDSKGIFVFKTHWLPKNHYFTYTTHNRKWRFKDFYGTSEELLETIKSSTSLQYMQHYIQFVETLQEPLQKYELAREQSITFEGRLLYRIRATKNFATIKKGDLGGFVASTDNLSQEGDCWIYNDAKVMDDTRISDDAVVTDDAIVKDFAQVNDKATVSNNSIISDNAIISGNAVIYDKARVSGHAKVYESALICDKAHI